MHVRRRGRSQDWCAGNLCSADLCNVDHIHHCRIFREIGVRKQEGIGGKRGSGHVGMRCGIHLIHLIGMDCCHSQEKRRKPLAGDSVLLATARPGPLAFPPLGPVLRVDHVIFKNRPDLAPSP